MSEVAPIPLGRPVPANALPSKADAPAAILRQMDECLAALDRAGAGIAAAHLSLAIDHARAAFGLADDGSGTD